MKNRLARNARTTTTKRSTNTREEKFEVGVGCGGFRVECTKQNRAREGGEGGGTASSKFINNETTRCEEGLRLRWIRERDKKKKEIRYLMIEGGIASI